MPKPSNRPSQRAALLEASLDLLRAGEAVSLDSAARAAGVSKPGLMYHFSTKEALVAALVDHVVDRYERELVALMPVAVGASTPRDRLAAYVRWAITHHHDAADLVMLADPRLCARMCARWADRLGWWVAVPDDLPEAERARLHAVRLLADGCWYADATGILPIPEADRAGVLATALSLLGEDQ